MAARKGTRRTVTKKQAPKAGTPKKRGIREPQSVGVIALKSGGRKRVGHTTSVHRSHRAFKKKPKKPAPNPERRPTFLPTGPIEIPGAEDFGG
jgi:hypothetical protein